jgi:putative mRNA 3-end processing factor
VLTFTNKGIYCRQADLHIDPWLPVNKAVITHAHSDHARSGSRQYLGHHDSERILRHRLGNISLQTLPYYKSVNINGVNISLHPAGHIIGSAQVRLEYKGEVWVVSGDYKVQHDHYTVPFEVVKCHHFITESTFGMPVYNFPAAEEVNEQLNDWIDKNTIEGHNSVIIGYALGKAQRILKAISGERRILLHTAIYNTNEAVGFSNAPYKKFQPDFRKEDLLPGVVVATGSAVGSPWLRRFEPYRLAICSGWMQLRGARRRNNADKGFVMSDHADWAGLNYAVKETGAENIYVTHGYKSVFAKWLREKHGLNAVEVETLFEGETISKESGESEPEAATGAES